MQRAASVYSQTIVNKASRTNVRSTTSSQSQTQSRDKILQNRHPTVKTPVKIKMQSTIKRLSSEEQNTPSRPNAFNLPKCSKPPNHQSLSNNQAGVKPQHNTTNNTSKFQRNIYSVKLHSVEGVKENKIQNATGYFVSSPQAKTASAMGISNFGTAYNSVVAAANRGYINGKYLNSHPLPQVVVPKTFPASGLAGGEIISGGNTMNHPPAPPGVVALNPQNVGLGLPFCKYYNTDLSNRRGSSYVSPDSRFGPSYLRVSGIYEWLSKQQCDSGLFVSSYYPSNEKNDLPVTLKLDTNQNGLELTNTEHLTQTDVLVSNNNSLNNVRNAVQQECKSSFPPSPYEKSKSADRFDEYAPFNSKLSCRGKGGKPLSVTFKKPKWEEFVTKNTKVRRRRKTASREFPPSQKDSTLPLINLYSLSQRHHRSIMKSKQLGLTISCPSV